MDYAMFGQLILFRIYHITMREDYSNAGLTSDLFEQGYTTYNQYAIWFILTANYAYNFLSGMLSAIIWMHNQLHLAKRPWDAEYIYCFMEMIHFWCKFDSVHNHVINLSSVWTMPYAYILVSELNNIIIGSNWATTECETNVRIKMFRLHR